MSELTGGEGRDWPHDPDGDEGSENGRKFGMAILAKKLDQPEEFPLSKATFVDEYADDPIRLNHRRVVSVADIFEHVEADSFETMTDFHKAVGRGMRQGGLWEYQPVGEPGA